MRVLLCSRQLLPQFVRNYVGCDLHGGQITQKLGVGFMASEGSTGIQSKLWEETPQHKNTVCPGVAW